MKIKKLLKRLLVSILIFIGLILLYLGVEFCFARITVDAEPATTADVDIYIRTNGVHTDIVVPVENEYYDWSKQILFSNTISKDTSYNWLGIGWGDKGFYLETPTWADLKVSTAFKAAFALSTSAIHATFYKNIQVDTSTRKITISREQYARLNEYILNSLQINDQKQPIFINTNAVYGKSDAFYEAKGSYNLFHTCNTWANNALKSCGQKHCFWTAFDTGIFLKYKLEDQN
ncbi:MAG: TIGR02117 family protein [Flavitalea sp.]